MENMLEEEFRVIDSEKRRFEEKMAH